MHTQGIFKSQVVLSHVGKDQPQSPIRRILGAAELSFSRSSFFPPHTLKTLLISLFSFESLGHQLFPPYESSFCLQFYLLSLAHLLSLHSHTPLFYNWTIFLGAHMKVTGLSHTRAMHNQTNWGHMYILQQHSCSISILLPLSVLPQHAEQSIMPAAAIRSNSYNRAHSS